MGLFKLFSCARFVQRGHRVVGARYCGSKPPKDPNECGAEPHSETKEAPASSGSDGKKAVVVGVYEEGGKFELTPAAAALDQESGGKISKQLNEVSGRLALGRAFLVSDVGGYSAAALASYGPRDAGYNELEGLHEGRENVRWGVGAGVSALRRRGATRVAVDGGAAHAHDAAAEAAELAAWRFEEFKSSGARSPTTRVELLAGGEVPPAGARRPRGHLGGGAIRGRAQNWARFLSDMPANRMTPIDLAQAALDMLCPLGVKVTAHDRTWIAAQRMEAFMAVARGSCEEPVMLECEYKHAAGGPTVLVAAKGVTFDSGGLCLKKPSSMVENRGSMAGAAAALAAMKAIAELKVPLNVVMVIPLCENMVSGQCMKVGDVVRALNGLSIQIEDTDMEGRLMLADALVYGQAAHRPALVIDVATLTHGILLATGGGAFGCFSNSDRLWRAVRAAGATAGDRPWRFPLWDYYHRQLTDDPAVDLRNKGSGKATPCLGAAFLKNFVCGEWLHLDTTGVGKLAHSPPPYLRARRMTGRPARTLVHTLLSLAEGGGGGGQTDRNTCD
ncbi:cytosol aminopeptidase-like [Choristoneura fumiferana]|uniref:cytosol aminopeptidase-like n=1 Tax=Choristoneura fumiferana TaxID=7141 RepID=UPI003D15451D